MNFVFFTRLTWNFPQSTKNLYKKGICSKKKNILWMFRAYFFHSVIHLFHLYMFSHSLVSFLYISRIYKTNKQNWLATSLNKSREDTVEWPKLKLINALLDIHGLSGDF